MRRATAAALSLTWISICAPNAAQAQTAKLEFEVASVKPSGPITSIGDISVTGGPGTRSPERFTYRGATLRKLLFRAYGLLDIDAQVAGPAWINTEHYAVNVKMAPGTTEEQFQKMFQNLLTERFQMVLHHETKELPVFELVGKNGSKLKESVETPAAGGPAGFVEVDPAGPDGFPVVPVSYSGIAMNTGIGPSGQTTQSWVFRRQTTSQLASFWSTTAGRRVLHKTGLTGKYDLNLYFEPQRPGEGIPDHPVLTMFDAVQQQLGLRLVDAKAPFDVVVVDHAEKTPVED